MKYLTLVTLLITSFMANAQSIEMADTMRSEGKIYVVVAVLCVILMVLIIYLISIDRKVSKLEKEINS